MLASPKFEQAFGVGLDHETTRRLAEQLVRSPELGCAMEDTASSPALGVALAQKTKTLTDELVDGIRTRTRTAD